VQLRCTRIPNTDTRTRRLKPGGIHMYLLL
jgi:hypothetical protein